MVLGKEIKRVALINPFQVTSEGYDNEVILRKGQSTELPLGLAYLSAYLKRYGYEVKIFDAHMAAIKGIALGRFSRMEEAEDELLDSVRDFRPDLVGITCPFHYIYKTAHRIAGRITGCPVVNGT